LGVKLFRIFAFKVSDGVNADIFQVFSDAFTDAGDF
jgi:hypothetical protein